jgi:hypothetical protein
MGIFLNVMNWQFSIYEFYQKTEAISIGRRDGKHHKKLLFSWYICRLNCSNF